MVDFPEAESPVNQIVMPRCLRRVVRSARVSDGCQVMFVAILKILCEEMRVGLDIVGSG